MAGAMGFISAGFSAVGKISQAQAEKADMENQQHASEYQAQVSRNNAENVLSATNANEELQRRKSASQLGAQRAALAEGGMSLSSGTGGDLTNQSALNAEMDALNIRYQGTLRARDQITQAQLDDYTARGIGAREKQFNAGIPMSVGAAALSSYSSAKGGSYGG